jgi:VanZ family protein
MQTFYRLKLWLSIGALLLTLIAVLSLAFVPAPSVPMPAHFDKYEHLLAYAVLSGYWCQLFQTRRAQVICAIALIAFGAALELVQAFGTDHRSGDWWDLLANTLGVLMGWMACQTRLGNLLTVMDQRLAKRRAGASK